MYCYIGSRTTQERKARGQGITVCKFDQASGALQPVQVVSGLANPSYLVLNQDCTRLYTVHGDGSEISSFAVDHDSGELTWQSTQSCEGKNPVHLALSIDEKYLVISNHITSSLAVMPLDSEGALQTVSQLIPLSGKIGPHRIEQPFAKPHFNPFDPSGRYCLVPDKGLDGIFVWHWNGAQLMPTSQAFVHSREGAGPRNLALHPQFMNGKPWVYVINELDSTLVRYDFDLSDGTLTPRQCLSSLSEDFTGNSRASGIAVHPSGHALYASNRGEDSVAVFSIDQISGKIALIQTITNIGKTPRFITLDPSGQWLVALGEDSDTVMSLPIQNDGRLDKSTHSFSTGSPVCLVFG